jgi:hypothetical protein
VTEFRERKQSDRQKRAVAFDSHFDHTDHTIRIASDFRSIGGVRLTYLTGRR